MEILRDALRTPVRAGGCLTCAHFCTDLATIERALPGLPSFSSIHASVRADDGLCTMHGTLSNGRRACDRHLRRI